MGPPTTAKKFCQTCIDRGATDGTGRTNDPEGAHLEYFRGIENPIGIKVGASCTRDQVARWFAILDWRITASDDPVNYAFPADASRPAPLEAMRNGARQRD